MIVFSNNPLAVELEEIPGMAVYLWDITEEHINEYLRKRGGVLTGPGG